MKDKPSEKDRIFHMIEAINRIIRFTDGMSIEDFYADEMAQYAIIKNFEIIGEAAFRLSKEFREDYENIEWRKITAFRHILVHDYYKINMEIVWNSIENKLTGLKIDLEEIIDRI